MPPARSHRERPRTAKLERAAQILAALLIIASAVFVGKPSFTNAAKPQRGIHDPQIALSMARSVFEVDAVLSDVPSPDREVIRIKQYVDFAIILFYTTLGVIILVFLWRRTARIASSLHKRLAFGLLIVLAFALIMAFLHNLFENFAILELARTPLARITPGNLKQLNIYTLVKWISEATGMLILGSFWGWFRLAASSPTPRIGKWNSGKWVRIMRAIGMLEIGAGLFILFGVFGPDPELNGGPNWLNLISWANLFMVLGLVLNAATLRFLVYESPTQNRISNPV